MEQLFFEVKKLIDEADKILLVSHQEPDGDAWGSLLGLKIALEELGKQVDAFSLSPLPENFKFLPQSNQIKRDIQLPYDIIFGLDYGDFERLETVASGLSSLPPAITFDHHPLVNQTGKIKIIDANFSSTCEIIYQFLESNSLKIDKEIATCLLTGIFTDTWSFRHPNATAKTLQVVGELLLKGAYLNKIVKLTNQNNIDIKSKIWGRALAKINLDKEKNFIFCFLSYQDLNECQATSDDLSGLASLLGSVPEAKFSLVLAEFLPGQLDGSLRALPNKGVDVSQIAKRLGGGGHKLAAGFKTRSNPKDILEELRKLIRSNEFDKL